LFVRCHKRKELQENEAKALQEAAKTIFEADFLLLATGAGFSKDSGLAVYKDIADVEAWRKRGLKYHNLCQPCWLDDDPELFYGFWGKCFNDYRTTKPHEGYGIIKKWKEELFNNSEIPKEFRSEWTGTSHMHRDTCDSSKIPGAFFIYTSNVDHHSVIAGFLDTELNEIHGSTEIWQCSHPCINTTWVPPQDFEFDINLETMTAKSQPFTKKQVDNNSNDNNNNNNKKDEVSNEKITEEKKTETEIEEKMKEMKINEKEVKHYAVNNGFVNNHPLCIHCGALARPAILMFGDGSWVSNSDQSRRSSHWFSLMKDFVKSKNKKIAIIEIGCGINVPTVRRNSERVMSELGGNCTLIRINPDFPLADDTDLSSNTISIMAPGLQSIRSIDHHLMKLINEKKESTKSNNNTKS